MSQANTAETLTTGRLGLLVMENGSSARITMAGDGSHTNSAVAVAHVRVMVGYHVHCIRMKKGENVMARMRIIRYRRPSMNTMLGITRAKKRLNQTAWNHCCEASISSSR